MLGIQLILLANAVLLAGLGAVSWRNRRSTGAELLAVLQFGSVVWVALTIVGLGLGPGLLRLHVWGAGTGMSLVVVVLWLAFILGYTGQNDWLEPRRFGVAAAPLLVGAGFYLVAPDWPLLVGQVEQTPTAFGTVVDATIGPLGVALGIYLYCLFAVGGWLVVRTVWAANWFFFGQAFAFLLGTLVTVVASLVLVFGLVPVDGFPIIQVSLGVQSLLLGYAVFRQEFLGLVPAINRFGERAVFEELDDGLLLVASDGTVVRANPQARRYLDTEGLVGSSVESAYDAMGLPADPDLPARFQRGSRTFQVAASTVTGWREESVGRALVVRDVSSLVGRQQRLEVLNRILRHNVRNEVTVILGVSHILSERADDEVERFAAMLEGAATDLTAVSEKALEIEKAFDRTGPATTVDLRTLVDDVVAPLADDHPDATVDADVGVDELHTRGSVLALVLGELVENALVHTGEAPTVALTVTRTVDGGRFAISDDGPGVPSGEVDPIRSGTETELHHASSLGLWIVYWGVQSLGGTFDVDASDEGTTVEVVVPDERVPETDGP